MKITLILSVVMWLLVGQGARADHAALPDGVTPEMATWLWGYHTIPGSITRDGSPYLYAYPHTDADRITDPPWTEVAAKHVKPGMKAPAVVFLHGCSGIIRGGVGYRILLLEEGFAIFEPDAYARPGHTCDTSSIVIRSEEVACALDQIRRLPWVDQDRLVLMGFSEGGSTVGYWGEPGFAAHVILGAPARSRAPAGVPVLAVAGAEDTYADPGGYERFNSRPVAIDDSNGGTQPTGQRAAGSKAILIAGRGHDLLPEFQEAIKTFLRECCQ